jgi:hypothetical protein
MNIKYVPHKELRVRSIKFQPSVTGVHGNPTNGDETSKCYKTQEQQPGHRTGEGRLNRSIS